MPRTRQDMSREAKLDQILEAAERRLRKGGFEALSVADIARELGIAHNAIYWYFGSKDELAVASFEHIITKLLTRKPKKGADTHDKIMWFVEQLGDLYPIRASFDERARRSLVIAVYLDDLNSRLRTMAKNVMCQYVPDDDLDLTVAAFLATVQGTFLTSVNPQERRQLVSFALDKMIGSNASRTERRTRESSGPVLGRTPPPSA